MTTSDVSRRDDLWTWGWRVSLLTAAYFVSGTFGMQLASFKEGVTLVWGPTGISLAALLLFGQRLWPGVFLGALIVNLGNPAANLPSALVIAIGNTLEAVVGAALLVHVADFRSSLERMKDVISFLLIGALGCTTISATVGVGAYYVFGFVNAGDRAELWAHWWLGDLGGALVMTPMLLVLVDGSPSWKSLVRRKETWFALSCLLATSFFAFFGPDLGLLGFSVSVSAVPVLVWVGTRLGPRATTTASFIMILIATAATVSGNGPFILGTQTESMLLLWSWAMLIGITGFALAAVVEQRNAAERRYRLEETERLHTEKQKMLLLERERLTREMHDGLGGQIVSILAMVERGLASPPEIAEAIRRAIDDIRIVIDSLGPATGNLPASLGKLRDRLDPLLGRNGITLSWHVDDRIEHDMFAAEDALHVLRIIQEAVTNSLRHADASAIAVRISLGDHETGPLQVSIRDDGRGLPEDRTIGGRGINNIKSRAKELGAETRIEDTGSGTQVKVTIPLSRKSPNANDTQRFAGQGDPLAS